MVQDLRPEFLLIGANNSLSRLPVHKDDERRHGAHLMRGGQRVVLVNINLEELDLTPHLGRHLLHDRRDRIARPTPAQNSVSTHARSVQ